MAKECQGVLFDGYAYSYRHCTEQLDTYFVYDVKGNLCFVLQPMYQTTANLGLYAFQYKYDNRNRCIWKKLPGAEYISYEYNDHDQLAFSQDGNQRAKGIWTFYVYDNLNRLTQQGESSGKNTSGTPTLRYYYDDYSFVGTGLFTNQEFVAGSASAKGKLTGCQAAPINVASPARTVYHYDSKGRMIKETASNALGGFDIRTITYTFTDQPATVTHTHTANGKPSLTEVYTYTYDHSDRISSVTHKLNSGSTVPLASYTYDNKGRLATKKLHGSSSNQLTYAYNIRSWITSITSGKFTQTLGYGSHYNGNISSMNWTANGSSHSYAFTYDGVNRMLNATHGTGAYTEKVTGYDKNGNITGLQRYNSSLVDNLTYTYNGNQLTKVEDATGNATGFTNGASTTNEYTYDANGNLTKDSNKGIASITYNSLNLPQVVTFSNGNTITYLYTADGKKLRTVHVTNGTATTTDYSGNVIYENGTQKLLLTEEGYINLSSPTTYYYYLKDHQGNNRVVLSSSGTVAETNHYYPFGGVFSTSSSVQPYKYNGKELDSKIGLNWYDYGARHYDVALGRWFVADPLSEKYYATSPYAYCLNNPVLQYDPDGCRVRPSNPVRRGYRNGGRPNPYAFYPRGVQPQSYRKISQVSYKGGSGLYERIALGEQNYVKDVTVGDNTVQMTRGNTTGMKLVGYSGLLNTPKEFSEQLLEMSTETIYYKDGRKSKVTNYVIKDEKLALAQEVYSKKYSALSEQLGNDMSLLEKNAIIQEEIGISPLQAIIIDMLMNQSNYEIEENKQIIPEFRQGY